MLSVTRASNVLSGLLVGIGLMVQDELLTLARYCGKDCPYPIPLLGTWNQYDASGFAWTLILAGLAILLLQERLK